MIKLPLSTIRAAALCLPLTLLASCGSGTEAVPGSVLTINPVSVTVAATQLDSPPTPVYYTTQAYQLTLKSPSGYPQVGVEATILIKAPALIYKDNIVIDPANVVCVGNNDPMSGPFVAPQCVDTTLIPLPSVYKAKSDSSGNIRVTMIYAFFGGEAGTDSPLEIISGSNFGKTDVVLACADGTAGMCP